MENKCKETLGLKGIIEIGENAGETVESCVRKYGKKSLMNVLRYYNLEDEVMEKYGIRLKPHVESETPDEKKVTNVRKEVKRTTMENDYEEIPYFDEDEYPYFDEETQDGPISYPVDYDPEDEY